jgi:hypothetical protein
MIGSRLAIASLAALGMTSALSLLGSAAASACSLNSPSGAIQHVVYIQFDNTHLDRDVPNVPSDLEQIPSLLNFIKGKGTLMSSHHTILIAHTAGGILTSLTGLYGDRTGQSVSNAYAYFKADGNPGFLASFSYWNDTVADLSADKSDNAPNMVNSDGSVTPAPWVPFTRAGCDVGMVAAANTVLENIGGDINTVFGAGSPEAMEASSDKNLAATDFEGLAIHCAANSPLCNTPNAKTDPLPKEPGGYDGFKALFGAKYVNPAITKSLPLKDLSGNVIQDAKGNPGFPGFDGMSAAVSLGYVASMLEAGVPVVYAYVSDAHDNHAMPGTFGPGEAGYVAQLKSYDTAFSQFFSRLAAKGIDQTNTLFVFTADEGDHFVGAPPSPANCDGITNPCTWVHDGASPNIGEVNADLSRLVGTAGDTTPFAVHSDSAPTFYVNGNPGPMDAKLRKLELDVAGVKVTNPLNGKMEPISLRLVDQAGMKMLHMVTGDPKRTPSFVMFANPDYYVVASDASSCASGKPCVFVGPAFAWNHGDFQNEIAHTWLGLVGPGVNAAGLDASTWSDHADIRPTILALTGLKDSYVSDGRVILEALTDKGVSASLAANRAAYVKLGVAYKNINAAFGQLGLATLDLANKGITADDATYAMVDKQIADFTQQRDALAAKMSAALDNAAFHGGSIDPSQADAMVQQASTLATAVQGAAK